MSESARKLEGATLKRLLSLVKEHTGINMEERKRDLLSARIRPRLRLLGLETFEQYIEHVETAPTGIQEFVNLVTTNETLFFRTATIWDYYQKEFLPEWFASNPGGTLKIWSAASSTGEEALSLAMSCEEFKARNLSFKYRIYASDIATDVLDAAKAAIYKGKSVEEFKNKFPDLFGKYFSATENGYRASAVLTANIEYQRHNLHQRPFRENFFDVVFLRNVLIYFDEPTQLQVLENIHRSLQSKGKLFLGESESLVRFKTSYVFERPLIYRKD